MRVLVVTALLVMVGLAGCVESEADSDGADPIMDRDVSQLQSGKGAIAGLLVDDRFRPIHLTDNPQGEFQTTGFILLQETGKEARTNENGEFTFVDLDPGSYTLRVTAAGHEATPQRVTVTAGQFVEESVIARRLSSADSIILTQEYSIFIPCSTYMIWDCTMDQSGDSGRTSTGWSSLEEFLPELEYIKVEAKMNQPAIYCVEVRYPQLGGATSQPSYADWCGGEGTDYISGILQHGENYMDDGRDPFDAAGPSDIILFYFGNNELTCWSGPPASYRCAGVGFGVKAQFLVSLFIGEPEVDLESYCLLC